MKEIENNNQLLKQVQDLLTTATGKVPDAEEETGELTDTLATTKKQ